MELARLKEVQLVCFLFFFGGGRYLALNKLWTDKTLNLFL